MRDGSATRERIERTALRLFAKEGVEGTTLRDVAREAKVSLGAISNHFPSKDELEWQIFVRIFAEVGNELHRRAHAERTLERKLRAMVGYVFQVADSEPERITFLFDKRHDYDDDDERLTTGIGNPFLAFRSVIAEGIEEGLLERQNINIATTMTVGIVNQLVDAKVAGHLHGPMKRLTEHVTKACLKMLRA